MFVRAVSVNKSNFIQLTSYKTFIADMTRMSPPITCYDGVWATIGCRLPEFPGAFHHRVASNLSCPFLFLGTYYNEIGARGASAWDRSLKFLMSAADAYCLVPMHLMSSPFITTCTAEKAAAIRYSDYHHQRDRLCAKMAVITPSTERRTSAEFCFHSLVCAAG